MSLINGGTAVYGLIGGSLGYSLSPLIHNELARLTGINSVYTAFSVKEPSSLKKAVEGAYALGIKGLNVTIPYKKDVMPFLCEVDDDASKIGAVNTLKYTENGYVGYNTDVYGVIKAFEARGVDFRQNSLLILGAGGGAAAVAFAAAQSGVKQIYIANRTNINSEPLASRLKKYYNISVNTIGYGELRFIKERFFIAQATPVGMNEEQSPVDGECVSGSSGVFDIIYSPPMTKILKYAENYGKPFFNGFDMLIYQAARAFEIWNGAVVSGKLANDVSRHVLRYCVELEETQ